MLQKVGIIFYQVVDAVL